MTELNKVEIQDVNGGNVVHLALFCAGVAYGYFTA